MAHYLTFSSNVTCTVNGTTVSSGYELHNGDVIVASTNIYGASFEVNSAYYSNGDTVDISDSDIVIYASGGSND